MEPAELINADKQLSELRLTSAIAEKNESLASINFCTSLSLLITGGVALVMGQSLGETSEYSDPLTSASISALIATGGWFVGSIFSIIEHDKVTGKAMRIQKQNRFG